MAKFIHLEELKAFVNLDYVTLVTEEDDGKSLAVNIVDLGQTQVVGGKDAANLLAALRMEVMGRR